MPKLEKSDWLYLISLVLLAIFIWFRDTSWMTTSDDTLPILVSIPVFVWLGWPWNLKEGPITPNPITVAVGAFVMLLGIITNLTFLLSLGWVCLLWSWLSQRLTPESRETAKKLMVFPLMAFPWISLDFTPVGWWFRLSGAHVAAGLFSLLGLNVVQEGTNLIVSGIPISVEAACSGLNTLQSMFIAGSVVAFIFLQDSIRYWLAFPQLFIMAWIANTLRIIVLSFAALLVSVEFAMGAFHTWGGWLVIVTMFAMCWTIFSLEEPKAKKEDNDKGE